MAHSFASRSVFYPLNWDEKSKTEDKNGCVCVFFSFIQMATRKINLCVCSWLYCMFHENGRAMQRATESEWVAQPTNPKSNSKEWFFICCRYLYCMQQTYMYICCRISERNETKQRFQYIFILCRWIVHHIVIFLWIFRYVSKRESKWMENVGDRGRERGLQKWCCMR